MTATATLSAQISIETLSEAVRVELAYLARSSRLVNPNGTFDSAGRWYPDEAEEGGAPNVRSPSRAWPYSYMVACRTKKWCAQLPAETRDADARAAVKAIVEGRLALPERLAKKIAS